jgi:protein translocase SecG subunit
MNAIYSTLISLHIFVSLFLVFVIILQKTTGNGLFTTSQSNPFMSGAEITQFITKLTSILIVLFFVNTLVLARISYMQNAKKEGIVSEQKPTEVQIPVLE